MNKKRHLRFYFLSLDLVLGLSVFLYTDFLCKKDSCYELQVSFFEPLFFTLLGLLPTLALLLFFSDRIFISWLKHIAWWIVLVTVILVKSNDHENDFSMFGSDNFVTGITMTILFIITLVYALIMNKKLKGKPNLTCPF